MPVWVHPPNEHLGTTKRFFEVRRPYCNLTISVNGLKCTLHVTDKPDTKFQHYRPSTSIFGGLALASPEGASSFVNKLRSGKYSPKVAFGTVTVNFAATKQRQM